MENPVQPDHDLLIALNTKFDSLSRDFKDMSDNVKERLTRLEESKLDKTLFTDFLIDYKEYKKSEEGNNETRDADIAYLKKWLWISFGAISILQIIIGYYLIIKYGGV